MVLLEKEGMGGERLKLKKNIFNLGNFRKQ